MGALACLHICMHICAYGCVKNTEIMHLCACVFEHNADTCCLLLTQRSKYRQLIANNLPLRAIINYKYRCSAIRRQITTTKSKQIKTQCSQSQGQCCCCCSFIVITRFIAIYLAFLVVVVTTFHCSACKQSVSW